MPHDIKTNRRLTYLSIFDYEKMHIHKCFVYDRFIRMACECLGPRGDDKNGCRKDWLGYLLGVMRECTLTSFRENRFNNLFQVNIILLPILRMDDIFGLCNWFSIIFSLLVCKNVKKIDLKCI